MVVFRWTRAALTLFVAVVVIAAAQPSAQTRRPARPPRPAPPSPPPRDGHLPHAVLETELRALADAHRGEATLVEIGTSRGGRKLWALEIAAAGALPPAERPGILVVANLAPDQIAGSTLALGVARTLLASADAGVRRQLADCVFYVVPRLDADGSEAAFAPVVGPRRGNLTPFDDDNDGRVDEDPPEDLNGDGLVTLMRVKDPVATLAPMKDEPRLMRRADPSKGEGGGWAVYWEGVDSDGDGFLNEDGAGGTDLDRNFPHQYPAYTPGAGRFMMSEDEARALLDYVLARRNIAAVVAFGATDTLVGGPQSSSGLGRTPPTGDLAAFADEATTAALAAGMVRDATPPAYQPGGIFDDAFEQPAPRPPPPPSAATTPKTTIDATDLEIFRHVAERYRTVTGLSQLPPTRRAAGAFHEWAYYQFGVPAFSTPGAALPAPPAAAKEAAPASGTPPAPPVPVAPAGDSDDAKLLAWVTRARPAAFLPWTPFVHPALGEVEIGGWRPFGAVPTPAEVAPLVEPHARFLVELSTFVPRVVVASAGATRLGGGLCRVRAEVENAGRWPTALQHAIVARAVPPARVSIEIEAAAIVSGAARNQFFPTLAGSGKREKVEWIVKARPGQAIAVRVTAQKGGTASQTVRCE